MQQLYSHCSTYPNPTGTQRSTNQPANQSISQPAKRAGQSDSQTVSSGLQVLWIDLSGFHLSVVRSTCPALTGLQDTSKYNFASIFFWNKVSSTHLTKNNDQMWKTILWTSDSHSDISIVSDNICLTFTQRARHRTRSPPMTRRPLCLLQSCCPEVSSARLSSGILSSDSHVFSYRTYGFTSGRLFIPRGSHSVC